MCEYDYSCEPDKPCEQCQHIRLRPDLTLAEMNQMADKSRMPLLLCKPSLDGSRYALTFHYTVGADNPDEMQMAEVVLENLSSVKLVFEQLAKASEARVHLAQVGGGATA